MSYIGIPPFGQTVRSVTTATATSGQTTFNISGGYVVGYVDVYLNGLLLAPTAYTATNGTTVVLGTGATVGDKFQALSYQPVSLVDALKASNNLSEIASASTARTNLGLGSIATQSSSNVSISGGSITGITDLGVADGGTGASTLTGYVKGSGTSPLTASSTIPNTDITGLGTISTQDANNVSISGGSITGITDLAVADGGTGASSLTANNVILGNGTSPVQFVAPGSSGNILTSDGTTWTSAAPSGGGGGGAIGGQVFTGNGTFTIPTGVTSLKITVVGGGGGGQGSQSAAAGGAAGAGGGAAIKYLTGLTPGNTLSVTVGAGGTAGAATNGAGGTGGTSSVASGTQSITTVSATGGTGGSATSPRPNGGIGSNGDLNIRGGGTLSTINGLANGGSSIFGGGAPGRYTEGVGTAGGAYGGGGSGGNYATCGPTRVGGAGAAGVVIFEW